MMKKMIYQLISVCFLFGALASCSSEDEPGKSSMSTGISLELKTTGQTRSSVEPGTEAERQINSTSVWFFEDKANDADKAMFYSKIVSSSSTGNITLSFTDEELRLHNMTSEGNYEVYVVANLPTDATIDGETTLADLKGYSYTATTRPGSPFCMTGRSVGGHDFGKNSLISIPLLRVASRLDIKVKNATGKSWIINKISIDGDQKSVSLFAPASGGTVSASNKFDAAQTVLDTPSTNDEATCSGYIYENRSADAVKVVVEGSVDGTAKTWTAELKPDGAVTLPRNTICEVTLNLKEKVIVPTDVEATIALWDDKEMDTPIHGAYLETVEEKVEVSLADGGKVHIMTNSSSIHVDWSTLASDVFLDGYRDNTNADVPVDNNLAVLNFKLLNDDSDFTGSILITTNGMTNKVTLSRKKESYTFKIKSIILANSGYHLQHGMTVPNDLWLNLSGNVNCPIEVERNITWFYRASYYRKSDMVLVSPRTTQLAYTYNGTPGIESATFPIRLSGYTYDVLVVLEFGVGLASYGFTTHTYEFTIAGKQP